MSDIKTAPASTRESQPPANELLIEANYTVKGLSHRVEVVDNISSHRITPKGRKELDQPITGQKGLAVEVYPGHKVALTEKELPIAWEVAEAMTNGEMDNLSAEARGIIYKPNVGLSFLARSLLIFGKINTEEFQLLQKNMKNEIANPQGFEDALLTGPTDDKDHIRMCQAVMNLPEGTQFQLEEKPPKNGLPYVSNVTPKGELIKVYPLDEGSMVQHTQKPPGSQTEVPGLTYFISNN